jgi:hypothetical protein
MFPGPSANAAIAPILMIRGHYQRITLAIKNLIQGTQEAKATYVGVCQRMLIAQGK